MKVLLTGASGFVGAAVAQALKAAGHQVVTAGRGPASDYMVGELGPDTDWRAALAGIDTVVHAAARAHVLREAKADVEAMFARINRDGTRRLAEQAAEAGVRHFLFVSSIKVNGEATAPDRPFRPDDPPAPEDAYGKSKAAAEADLAEIATRTGMIATILRPPLVVGPGAKGNLALLLKVLSLGLPLPLGNIANRRSMVGLANLADAITFLVERRPAGIFLIADGAVSTPDLLRALAHGLGRRPVLLPFPGFLARLLARFGAVQRLTGSLVVDDSSLRALGWSPRIPLTESLANAWRRTDDR